METNPTKILEAKTREIIGPAFDQAIFKKALAKAKRWMVKAYGEPDVDVFLAESGDDALVSYYRETEKVPDGINTLNRGVEISLRKDRAK